MGLPPALVTALSRRGIHEPFAIQAAPCPTPSPAATCSAAPQTGSGKTLAFGLPLLARLGRTAAAGRRAPRGLVLVPTRELAQQVADALAPARSRHRRQHRAVYGGAPMGRQIQQLRRGVDVVVATPGRLLDLIERRRAATSTEVAVTVLDEADHMADLGFLPAVTRMLDQTPADGQRLLFSATLDGERRRAGPPLPQRPGAARGRLGRRRRRADGAPRVHVASARQGARSPRRSPAAPGRTLIFVRTKHGADRLAKQLDRPGVEAAAIHGELPRAARSGRSTSSPTAAAACWSPPTSPPAASTSTTSTWSCTSTRRTTTRTTCTARAAPRAPARPGPWCPSSSRARSAT